MKVCEKCGAFYPDDAIVCETCGTPLGVSDAQNTQNTQTAPEQNYNPYQQEQTFLPDQQPPQYNPPYQQQPFEQQPYEQAPYQQQSPYQQQPYQQQNTNSYQPAYQQPGYQQPSPYMARKRNSPMVLGIVGIVFAILLPIVTYCCSIPGLVMANKDIRMGMNSNAARVLNIVAICIAVVNSFFGIVNNFTGIFY